MPRSYVRLVSGTNAKAANINENASRLRRLVGAGAGSHDTTLKSARDTASAPEGFVGPSPQGEVS
jgi:hypothetical protein